LARGLGVDFAAGVAVGAALVVVALALFRVDRGPVGGVAAGVAVVVVLLSVTVVAVFTAGAASALDGAMVVLA
jgi:hypothetical protein